MSYTPVASLKDLKTRRLLCVVSGNRRLLLAFTGEQVYATDDLCSHEDASLSKGSLHGDCVKCPLHGSRFHLVTGEALDEPAEDAIATYAVKLDGDDILVDLPD
ncbi:MAG TPA: non-heme iron oxygenase ferredoxin subunit [Thiotrichales bacterium]|nr:non-heme iron oxygenase ferredoxin subunit [Thiotrichales bacterium]